MVLMPFSGSIFFFRDVVPVPFTSHLRTLFYHYRRDFESAEQHWREALKSDPNHAPTLAALAVLLSKVKKDYSGAEELYRRALGTRFDFFFFTLSIIII